jgi:nitrogen fixation/metabolism regulation signal transduction histidine kinase
VEDLSLHVLDIAENSIDAGARNITITVCEDTAADLLSIEITDDGRGMTAEVAEHAADPFYTTRTTRRVGLGLSLLREAAEAANGTLTLRSAPRAGTSIRATFQLSHIDRKPLGRMADTIVALIATPREIDITYTHTRDGKAVVFDTKEVRRQLPGELLNSVSALNIVREHLSMEEGTLAP